MSPTVVLRDGRPILSVGAAGGPTIISQTLLAIVRVVDFGHTPREALKAPRFHHQWKPDVLKLEDAWSPAVADELTRRGHRVERVHELGATQAVGFGSDGKFEAASDPRVPGSGATR
jgi:gamma-glutamyltranspeptidase/glutathione hydrolase